VGRYADEIGGHFNPLVYGVATRALPLALSALFNGLSPARLLLHPESAFRLSDQVALQGDREWLCRLARRGTLVFAPTHTSNLDPVIMGYALYRMGLPPVAYAAALNLFTNPIIGFFMRNVGAYAVDRKKTDPLYLEALQAHSTLLLEHGRHSLFFPGGRRSRSNRIETVLQPGLLGTTLAAALDNLAAGRSVGVYVVPCTISYPLVLEAATLIDDHFKAAGKARYIIEDDEFSQVRRWLDFITGLAAIDQQVTVTLGRPLDPFGNDVDLDGGSLDPRGRPVDPRRYVLVDRDVRPDRERDAQYTKDLAGRVTASFLADSVVFPTHVLARACFTVLRRSFPQPDLYRLLRFLTPDSTLSWDEVELEAVSLLDRLGKLAADRRIRLAPATRHGSREVLSRALASFGTYHARPVLERSGHRLVIGDSGLLVYYSNRLHGYGLPGDIDPGEASA
jgi:glycerol-3-phosphate O-acyltransferase